MTVASYVNHAREMNADTVAAPMNVTTPQPYISQRPP